MAKQLLSRRLHGPGRPGRLDGHASRGSSHTLGRRAAVALGLAAGMALALCRGSNPGDLWAPCVATSVVQALATAPLPWGWRRRAEGRQPGRVACAGWGPPVPGKKPAPAKASAGEKAGEVSLLGAGAAWRLNDWRTISDVVRGGASQAQLKGATVGQGVTFSGLLQPAGVPGGIGQAGVSLLSKFLPEQFDGFRGLRLEVDDDGSGRDYWLALGMRGSILGLTHEFRFRPQSGPIDMPFEDFVPMMRGRPAELEEVPYLDLSRIEVINFQVQGEATEDAAFSLTLRSLVGLPGKAKLGKAPETSAERWKCKGCGCANTGSAATCVRCGASKDVKTVDEIMDAKLSAATRKWECESCGRKNFPGATECHKCGSPRTL
mmetsp:Transcript_49270/g.107200  ORF Transcript_49270/g.107200 Transcript_49270/m.107200 type:complete len:377 (-) Transcript_49270:112-1242(-)